MESFSIEPVFGWYAVVTLGLIMIASLWLTITSTGVSVRARAILVGLRLLAILLLLLGWLRPGLVWRSQHESPGAVAVLMDQSQSFTLPSDTGSEDRWKVQQRLWQSIVSSTDLKFGQMQVVPYFFDQALRAVQTNELPGLQNAFKTPPSGRLTDLGKALSELQRMQVDPPLRAAILITDGTQTAIPPATEPTAVARQMAQLDQPLLVVGIGPSKNSSAFRDLAIESMPEHFDAFNKNEIQIPFVVKAQGLQGQPVTLSLKLREANKPETGKVEASKQLLVRDATMSLGERMQFVVPEPGEYILTVDAQLPKDMTEQIKSNNQALAFLTVREGGIRILYIEGEPRPEQRFLKWSLNSSKDFVVDYQWIQEKTRNSWPVDFRKAPSNIDFSKYDIFILGDVDSSAIDNSNFSEIRQRVANGAGILFLGGYHSFDAGGYGRKKPNANPLEPLFPVELSDRSQAFGAPVDPQLQTSQPTAIVLRKPHPITTLGPEPENEQIWKNLKPLLSINRLGKPKILPGVDVLAVSDRKDVDEPILVTGEYTNGRVLAFAGDSTYQWWLSGNQEAHKKFWRQAVLWLLKRDAISEGFVLRLDRRRLLIDETAALKIDWYGGSSNLPMPENIKIELRRDGKWLRNVESNSISPSRRESNITGLIEPGVFSVSLSCQAPSGKSYNADIAFIVIDESIELATPAADWTMMKNLVSANKSAGGNLYAPEEINKAIQWIRERNDLAKVTTLEKRRLGDAAWDAWIYLILFCVLLSAEWGLRKHWQLP
jgi:uncharacterized membrane protein